MWQANQEAIEAWQDKRSNSKAASELRQYFGMEYPQGHVLPAAIGRTLRRVARRRLNLGHRARAGLRRFAALLVATLARREVVKPIKKIPPVF